jgi:hypothetical protein
MGQLLNTSTTMMCPHGGQVTAASGNTRTKAGGSFVLLQSDTFTVAGCPFAIGPNPHPCVRVQWVQTALRNKVSATPVLNTESVGLCIAADGAPQGTAQIVNTQPRVSGQ